MTKTLIAVLVFLISSVCFGSPTNPCATAAPSSLDALRSCEFVFWEGWVQGWGAARQKSEQAQKIAEDYLAQQTPDAAVDSWSGSTGYSGYFYYSGGARVGGIANAQTLRDFIAKEFVLKDIPFESVEINSGFILDYRAGLIRADGVGALAAISFGIAEPLSKSDLIQKVESFIPHFSELARIRKYRDWLDYILNYKRSDMRIHFSEYAWNQHKGSKGMLFRASLKFGFGRSYEVSPFSGIVDSSQGKFAFERKHSSQK